MGCRKCTWSKSHEANSLNIYTVFLTIVFSFTVITFIGERFFCFSFVCKSRYILRGANLEEYEYGVTLCHKRVLLKDKHVGNFFARIFFITRGAPGQPTSPHPHLIISVFELLTRNMTSQHATRFCHSTFPNHPLSSNFVDSENISKKTVSSVTKEKWYVWIFNFNKK